MITVREVLNDAADMIESEGWYHGSVEPLEREGYCAETAIAQVAAPTLLWAETLQAFLEFLGLPIPAHHADSLGVIFKWNDAQENAGVVIKALRDAAEAQ